MTVRLLDVVGEKNFIIVGVRLAVAMIWLR